MMLKIYPLVLVLSTLAKVLALDFDALLNHLGDLSSSVTGQTYLFLGDDLKLNCTLNESLLGKNYTAQNIFFKFQYRAQGMLKCIPRRNIEVVDTNLATLIIQNVTFDNAGPYFCYVGRTGCNDGNIETVDVGSSDDVYIEYPPQNVTNFSCVVYNWDELMNCTWQHPVNYQDWDNIEVSIFYVPQSSLKREPVVMYKCPNSSRTSCVWNETNLMADRYYIDVTVKNKKNNATATSVFQINTSSVVKPDPVKDLIIGRDVEFPDCLFLSWNHSRIRQSKVYRIRHKAMTDETFHVLADNISDTSFTKCGYRPDTYYNFSVECYPTGIYSGYWSDPVYASNRTFMTAPALGPTITNGSFMSTECVNRWRTVTLMWQEVEPSAQNGVIDSYLIKLGERNLSNVSGDARAALVELPCYSTSELTILAHNEGGYSLSPSVLHIPPVDFTVSKEVQESFSVNATSDQHSYNDSLRAVWEVGEGADSFSYTIFWCNGVPVPDKSCVSEIKWSKVPGTQTFYNIFIPSSEAGKYLFGISQTDIHTGMTSGIFWSKCLFTSDPSIILQRLHVQNLNVDSGVNKVQVSWSTIECNYQSMTKVTNYRVKWCEATRCNDTKEIYSDEVTAKEYLYTVSALESNVKYKVTVQPKSYENVGDEFTPWKEAVSKGSEHPTWLAGVIVPPIIILLAVFIFWRCRKAWRKGSEKVKKYTLEPVLTMEQAPPRVPEGQAVSILRPVSTNQAAVRLLSVTSVDSAVSSESDDAEVTNSPQRTTPTQNTPELSDGHLQNERVGLESVSSSHEPAQPYQRFASIPSSHSSELHDQQLLHNGIAGQMSVSSNPASLQSYQQLAYLSSNPPSEVHSGHQNDRIAGHNSSNSESAESYQMFSYIPPNRLTETQTDLSFHIGELHPHNTVMSPVNHAVSHLRYEREIPTEETNAETDMSTVILDSDASLPPETNGTITLPDVNMVSSSVQNTHGYLPQSALSSDETSSSNTAAQTNNSNSSYNMKYIQMNTLDNSSHNMEYVQTNTLDNLHVESDNSL